MYRIVLIDMYRLFLRKDITYLTYQDLASGYIDQLPAMIKPPCGGVHKWGHL